MTSMSSGAAHLLLYGIFLQLRAAGIPLQVRDYLEGLRALRLYGGLDPFEALADVKPEEAGRARPGKSFAHRVRAGDQLVWLCQVLWARSHEERNIVERVITLEIGLPPSRLVRELHQLLQAPGSAPSDESQTEPVPVVPFEAEEPQPQVEEAAQPEPEGEQTAKAEHKPGEVEEGYVIPVTVVEPEAGDMSLPPLNHTEPVNDLTFLPYEPPIISPLWLVSLWRRYFIPVRKRVAMEIDAAATVRRAARTGKLLAPVMKLGRQNIAKLLLLVDTSEAMTPWRRFETVLVESLDPRASRLHTVEIRYFNGAPGGRVFRERNLRKAEPLAEVLKQNNGNPVLILGEAGAARTRNDPSFRMRMEELLSSASANENRPLIWVNPMPHRRWPGSLMDSLRGRPNVHAVELNPEALLRAVDLMRGISS